MGMKVLIDEIARLSFSILEREKLDTSSRV